MRGHRPSNGYPVQPDQVTTRSALTRAATNSRKCQFMRAPCQGLVERPNPPECAAPDSEGAGPDPGR